MCIRDRVFPESWVLDVFQRTALFKSIGSVISQCADRVVNVQLIPKRAVRSIEAHPSSRSHWRFTGPANYRCLLGHKVDLSGNVLANSGNRYWPGSPTTRPGCIQPRDLTIAVNASRRGYARLYEPRKLRRHGDSSANSDGTSKTNRSRKH